MQANKPMADLPLIHIKRTAYTKRGTPGKLDVDGTHICYTLELPWKNNQRNISCIPEGRYRIAWKKSPSKGWRLHIFNVPDRDLCMFHIGNWIRNILGCILPGLEFKLYDKNGDMMASQSRLAVTALEKLVPRDQEAVLVIEGPDPIETGLS